jgi:hypothetical protein
MIPDKINHCVYIYIASVVLTIMDMMWQEHLPGNKERQHFKIETVSTICVPRKNYRDFYTENRTALHRVQTFEPKLQTQHRCKPTGQWSNNFGFFCPAEGDNRLIIHTYHCRDSSSRGRGSHGTKSEPASILKHIHLGSIRYSRQTPG